MSLRPSGYERSRTSRWGDPDGGRANIRHFTPGRARRPRTWPPQAVCGSVEEVEAFVDLFAAIGVDEIIFNRATDDVDEVGRLAKIVL